MLLLAAVYISRPRHRAALSAPIAASGAALSPADTMPDEEEVDFTAMLSSPQKDLPSARDILGRSETALPSAENHLSPASRPYLPPSSAAQAGMSVPSVSKVSVPVSSARAAGAEEKAASSLKRPSAVGPVSGYTPPPVASVSGANRFENNHGLPNISSGRELAEKTEDIFSPFDARMTRREQTAFNRKLNDFSVGLERAIASAVLPKSKREQNIEKYLARARGEAAVMNDGVYAVGQRQAGGESAAEEVVQRLASQAAGIVNDVRANYGDSAAAQAQEIMNDFQAEMAQTLNEEGDPQEKNIKAQAVNNKYNSKLQELNNQAALEKMGEELRVQNEQYLKKIGETYGPQTQAAMRPVLEEFAGKRMQLWATPMSEEENVRQTLALDEQLRKEQERIVKETAPQASAGNLTALQNELTEKEILEEARKVEAGEMVSPVYRESAEVRAQNEEAWKKEGEAMVRSFEPLGPQVQEQVRQQMDGLLNYRRQLRQQAMEEGLSVAEVMRLDMEATKKANQALEQIRMEGLEGAFNEQYEKQFEQAPKDFTDQLRPIWEKYNKQRAELSMQTTDQQTYQTRIQQLAEQQQREFEAVQEAYMSGQQPPVHPQ